MLSFCIISWYNTNYHSNTNYFMEPYLTYYIVEPYQYTLEPYSHIAERNRVAVRWNHAFGLWPHVMEHCIN